MKQAQRLVPKTPELPQCEAGRVTNYANDTAKTDRQCKRRAKYRLPSGLYCTKHAGVAALALLLGEPAAPLASGKEG